MKHPTSANTPLMTASRQLRLAVLRVNQPLCCHSDYGNTEVGGSIN